MAKKEVSRVLNMAFVFKFPDLGEGVHEGKIVKWHVKVGDVVKLDQVLAEAETDKAVVEMPSPTAGTILQINFRERETINVGTPFIVIGAPGEAIPPEAIPSTAVHAAPATPAPAARPTAAPASTPSTPVTPTPSASGAVMATPATRQLARELNVDLTRVKGSGPGGRILPEDVKAAAASGSPAPTAFSACASASVPAAKSSEPLVFHGPVERVSLSTLRKAVSAKMSESWRHIPQATHFEDADVTDLWALREKEKENAKAQGVHLTLLPFIFKAAAEALKKHPALNASLDEATNEIVYKKYYHLGCAVDVPDGLIVVVIKDADKKGILQIGKEIQELAEKARNRKASLDEIRGGSFTITNIGSVGGTGATPIINYPESAILGAYRMRLKPVVVNGQVVVRNIMPLTVGFDHRIIDGAEAGRFTNDIVGLLSNPSNFTL